MAYVPKRRADPVVVVDEPEWPKILDHLRMQGYSFAALARACGTTRQKLYTIWDGTLAPEWYTGEVLRQLYLQES